MMKALLSALALLTGCLGPSVTDARGLTADAVLAFANDNGDSAALSQFFSCGAAGDEAYSLIASGSKAWVDVAVKLLPAGDGCVSESLHDALARALVRAPLNVLPLVNSAPSLTEPTVCIPFLSADEPTAKSLAYLRHEEAVLRAVHLPSLRVQRNACLEQVRRTRAAIN